MKNLVLISIIIMLFVNAASGQMKMGAKDTRKLFTQEDLLTCKRISEPKVSPDGKWVLYKFGDPVLEENKINNDIYIASIDGKGNSKLFGTDKAEYNAVWSPDGKQVAFISNFEGSHQVYVMDFPGGKPKKITNMPNGVANLSWSPDGKHFAFTSDVKLLKTPQEKYPKLSKAKVQIYTTLPVRHWDEWVDESFQHVFIVPVAGGEPKDIMKGELFDSPLKPFGGAEQIAWSPDGSEIAYTSKKVKDFAFNTNSDVYVYNLATGATKDITDGMMGFDKDPLFSPDGKWIAFLSQERAGFESDKIRLMGYNRINGQVMDFSANLDQWTEEYVWAPDSKSLYLSATDSGSYHIFNISIEFKKVSKVTNDWYNYGSGLDITKDGQQLIYCKQNMQRPPEVFVMNLADLKQIDITHANDKKFEGYKPLEVKERWITSTDGKKVQCWVIYPPDFDAKKKYPMLTFCQGGPQNMISQVFHYRWNFFTMASHGYVVLAPNRRGLPGFGQQWNDAISLDWGGQPMQDILAATDDMAKEPYINKDKMAAVGASAGGYATFWLAGNHNKRFQAFVSHSGVFNLESMYGSTEELWFPNWEYGGPYWDAKNKPGYDKNSPHRFAQNWDTPIMISTGGYDFRVPFTQSLEAFTVAQSKGIPSKLVYFPEQSHLILSIQEAVLWYNEYFEFLDRYCMQ